MARVVGSVLTARVLSSLGEWLRVEAPLDPGGALTLCLSGHPLTALAWLLPYLALRPGAASFFSHHHCVRVWAYHFVLFVVVPIASLVRTVIVACFLLCLLA